MSKKNVHVTHHVNGWAVKKVGNQKASFVCDTKQKATQKGIEIAKKEHSELTVHKMNGKIDWKNSYGNDPCPPKDKNK